MKNYFQKILTLFTRSEYPKSTQQEFYRWLVDKEHTSEKEDALLTLWQEALQQKIVSNTHQSYEQLRKNANIPYGKNAGFVRFISGRQSPPSFSFWQLLPSISLQ